MLWNPSSMELNSVRYFASLARSASSACFSAVTSLNSAASCSRSGGAVVGNTYTSNHRSSPFGVSTKRFGGPVRTTPARSEEHTAELQSRQYLVCRLLLEKKK